MNFGLLRWSVVFLCLTSPMLEFLYVQRDCLRASLRADLSLVAVLYATLRLTNPLSR